MDPESHIIEPLREHAKPLDELKLDPANANQHPEESIRAIADSLAEFGQRQVIVARRDTRTVIAGNGRLEAARRLGWKSIACVYVDDNDITALRYAIADNRTAEFSTWDEGALAQVLQTIRDDFGSLEGTGFDDDDLDELLSDFGGGEVVSGEERYTQKIEAPIYEITGKKPSPEDLFDDEKASRLLAEIEQADAPENVKDFLRLAAYRHVRFDFESIAEFYAHADQDLQRLMENSALVIIDFDRAIENGFVAMTQSLAQIVGEDYPA